MNESSTQHFTEGSRVRLAATGHVVTIEKISGHGIAIIEYDFGYRRMVMLKELSRLSSEEQVKHVA